MVCTCQAEPRRGARAVPSTILPPPPPPKAEGPPPKAEGPPPKAEGPFGDPARQDAYGITHSPGCPEAVPWGAPFPPEEHPCYGIVLVQREDSGQYLRGVTKWCFCIVPGTAATREYVAVSAAEAVRAAGRHGAIPIFRGWVKDCEEVEARWQAAKDRWEASLGP